ncbi:MAG: Uma2 family endonuclease [Gemmataceae bacterium]|nr:Uma2 family endonuclease [Gemmataceae bacterium]
MSAILTPPAPTAPVAPPVPAAPIPPQARTMPIMLNGRLPVTIPASVVDHDSYRAWARSDDYPEKLRTHWIDGALWVDTDMEQLYTHNRIKNVFCSVLMPLADRLGTGEYAGDGMLLTLRDPALTTGPDGLFVLHASRRSGRIALVPNARGIGCVELEGTPDMVLEAVSDSSVAKDTVRLEAACLQAGVQEYWRVDARAGRLDFVILRNDGTAWQPCPTPDGWQRSALFGHDFRLRQGTNPFGDPLWFLDVR